jgi:hypothetical protein
MLSGMRDKFAPNRVKNLSFMITSYNNNNKLKAFPFITGVTYLLVLLLVLIYKQDRSINVVLGALWSIGQIGAMIVLIFLYRHKTTGMTAWRIAGIAIAAMGATSYFMNYVFGYWLNMNTRLLLPLGAMLSAIGWLIIGIQVILVRRWTGWRRIAPLLVGLYPFAVMFPLLLITGHPSFVAIACWGIPWLIFAFALSVESADPTSRSNPKTMESFKI